MIFAVITQNFGCFLCLYGPTMLIKRAGLFLQGFFHIKTTLAYTYSTELMPENKKVLATTLLTACDAITLMVINLYLVNVRKNMHEIYLIMFYIGVFISGLMVLLVPESPQWLFIKKGSNSKEAIKALNYIAAFNGSKLRVPEDAFFDLVGQIVEENENMTMNGTTAGAHRMKINHSVNNTLA